MTAAAELERALGDPWSEASAIPFTRTVADDETERFPAEACRALDAAGLPAYYVPVEHGGRLDDYERVMLLVRLVARRDLTAIIAHAKTYLGAAAVWVAGSPEQRRRVADAILRGTPVALALTERDHGSDLVASDVRATRTARGYTLDGEKWLINNATRSGMLSVLARTDPRGGFRGCSLLLVDKAALPADRYRHLPKVRTLGIRGADISGIAFTGAELPPDAVIGGEGAGLEVAIKLLQVTRISVSGLSLGAADTALRIVVDFARTRRLYGATVLDLPHARETLATAFAELLVADALAIASARTLHAVPEQISLVSAITKFCVPTACEAIIRRAAVVLGARYYLREGHASGMFQKLQRDAALVSLFDGSTVVNLHALGLQLRGLVDTEPDARVMSALDLAATLPRPDLGKLALTTRHNPIAAPLRAARDRIAGPHADALLALHATLVRELAAVPAQLVQLHASAPQKFSRSAELFAHATRYAAVHAVASAFVVWALNRHALAEPLADGAWLAVGGWSTLAAGGVATAPPTPAQLEAVTAHLLELHARDRLFSLRDVALVPRTAP